MTPSNFGLLAHEGHGMTSPESPLHWLEPVHAVGIVTVIVLVTAARYAFSHRTEAKHEESPTSHVDH